MVALQGVYITLKGINDKLRSPLSSYLEIYFQGYFLFYGNMPILSLNGHPPKGNTISGLTNVRLD